ncbi:MAG: lipocalin-like domain-containing protein [Muribaculaceae bacterium]|nr:lipocalin-like domain-containing protein [Muribaculaceae bacterium]
MRKNITLMLGTALMMLLSACVSNHNDGDIGALFGTWNLVSMSCDGEKMDVETHPTVIQFQNNIIKVSRLQAPDQPFSMDSGIGTWEETEEQFLLNFTHSDDKYAPGTAIYAAPEWLGWEQNTILHLQKLSMSDKVMTWSYTSPDGRVWRYELKKQF